MQPTIDTTLAQKFGLTDLTPRYAPTEVLIAGERGSVRRVPVTCAIIHPAGTGEGPIYRELPKLELQTSVPGRSRWYGIVAGYLNSERRMVVIGTNPQDEVRMAWEIVPEDRRA